jgi:hypothetical protein
MIEQNLIEAMRVSHDVVLLVGGAVRGRWDAAAFLADPQVRSLFLGGGKAASATAGGEKVHDDASAA